ncbi:MAG: oligosaccharide flippase family protein [Ignavibacteriaceae bacterium]
MLDKLKQLTKDTAVYGISTMLGRFLNFILVPFYTHVFLPAEYGVIGLVYLFMALMNIVFLYGMDSAYLKFQGMQEAEKKSKDNFSTPFISVLLTSFLFCVLIILFKEPIFKVLEVPIEFSYLAYYVAGILFLDAVAVIPFIVLRLERKAKTFAVFRVLNILMNIFLNVYLIVFLKLGIEAVFISNLCASALSIFLLFPEIFKKLKIKFDFILFKKFLKFGLPYLPAGLAAMVIQVIDRYILQAMTDLDTLGIYTANYKLGIFMMLFVNMFQFAWQPFFLQNAKEKNAKEIFAKVLTYFTIIGSVILIILSLFIDDIIKIEFFGRTLIGNLYWGGVDIVPIILLAYLFNGMYIIFLAGIYIKEKSSYAPLITGLGALVNVIVNILLIPLMGIMGAAFATLAAYLTLAVGMFVVTQKFYRIEYEKWKITKIFFFIISIGGVYYYLFYEGDLNLIYKFLLLLAFVVLLYLFVFDKREIDFIKMNLRREKK